MNRGYRRAAWGLLAFSIAVIAWGGLVRATLSGDGCGDHWPLCNGEVVPVDPRIETVVELTHRVTSGLVWIWALAMVFASRRATALVRNGARWVFFFMTTEALVGAGLVLLKLVADNPSLVRGWWTTAHLLNTFFLLAALVAHAFWASGGGPLRLRRLSLGTRSLMITAIAMLLLVGASGAVAALGDTLIAAGTAADGSHLFVRFRVMHPVAALAAAALVIGLGANIYAHGEVGARRVAPVLIALVCLQCGLGFLDVLLRAPVWMQIVHLVVADLVWIALMWTVLVHSTSTAVSPSAALRASTNASTLGPSPITVAETSPASSTSRTSAPS